LSPTREKKKEKRGQGQRGYSYLVPRKKEKRRKKGRRRGYHPTEEKRKRGGRGGEDVIYTSYLGGKKGGGKSTIHWKKGKERVALVPFLTLCRQGGVRGGEKREKIDFIPNRTEKGGKKGKGFEVADEDVVSSRVADHSRKGKGKGGKEGKARARCVHGS